MRRMETPLETLSSPALFELARREVDGEDWSAISELCRRADPDDLLRALSLTRAESFLDRRLGCVLLGRFHTAEGEPAFLEESLPSLIEALEDPEDAVRIDAIYALSHRWDERALPGVLAFRLHPDAEFRVAATHAIMNCSHERPEAIAALIELTRDEDAGTRDWATFGLAQAIASDSPEIREALFARVADEDAEVRGEALIGLAERRDERAIEAVRSELRKPLEGDWAIEAARRLATPELVADLEAIERDVVSELPGWILQGLFEALDACRAGRR
jgi:HEAT repeat protein